MNLVITTETYLPYVSGISTSTHSIARYMADRGHVVTVIAPRAIRADKAVDQEAGIRVVRVGGVYDLWYRGRIISLPPWTDWAAASAITPTTDIVHIQEPGANGLAALRRARTLGIPVVGALHFTPDQVAKMVFLPHGLGVNLVTRYIRSIYNQYDAIMVPTATFVDFLQTIGVKRPMKVVSNGVYTNIYRPGTDQKKEREKLHLPQNRVLFLMVGRFDKDKYIDDVIRAIPRANPDIELVLAGVGPEERALRTLAQSLGVANRIHWIGQVGEPEMISLYQSVDGFVIMSIYEVQSIVTLQAISSGLPVIAVRAGALPELVREGKNGFLVEPHDSATLAANMNVLAADSKLRKSMGEVGRRLAMHHDKEKALAGLEVWYKTLTSKE